MTDANSIRNFVIIAHIDAGKSTLADRMLEITGTVDRRRMKPQYLDRLELERERGITIKMAPVRMMYRFEDSGFILNLIDTPGHSDFSYEVSRALAAVEGAILLVDGSKGIQAQTLANFRAARKAGLEIIGAVNKIDLSPLQIESSIGALAELLGVRADEIFHVSAKTGEGVEKLLEAVVGYIPPPVREPVFFEEALGGAAGLVRAHKDFMCSAAAPRAQAGSDRRSRRTAGSEKNTGEQLCRALIFDSLYDDHKGILAFVRVFDGDFKAGEEIFLAASGAKLKIKEVGHFAPELKQAGKLLTGEIGYIATGLKEPAKVKVGDTIIKNPNSKIQITNYKMLALPGYKEPQPVVFISFYPDGQTKFEDLKRSLERLCLTDSALSIEPDKNEALGRGWKVGFLGKLHLEIGASRLQREFNLEFLTSFPSVAYRVKEKGEMKVIKDAHDFPENPDEVFQPMIKLEIFSPADRLGEILNLPKVFDLSVKQVKNIGGNIVVEARMPLAELVRDFDDQLKSVSAGFASFSYELDGEEKADAEKMEILVAGEVVPALTRIVSRKDLERESRTTLELLKNILPRQQFAQSLQARVGSRIIAREDIAALRKDVTGYLYGGDRSRKMKLWQKQKRGKEKLKKLARVQLPIEVFREILKK